ncbi:isoprenyl transferase [Zafaria cholistanensis]|uniref:Isoprenyl transferase n=1 Tax=Zafaria cholistanensis TaxID=1682741 RepID=A0A5A7NV12_9MICC|nr:isoprenyl transferase [Zafaria cholistanensis]GER23857.1 isoprenyl transferase [Zafaria cholistanensis]
MELPAFAYRIYARKMVRELSAGKLPRHIGVVVDGNRRWAKLAGAPTAHGHQVGADKIVEFLGWCAELKIEVVTLYMLSTDNMSRSSDELEQLMGIIANMLDRLAESGNLRVQPVGALELLPDYLSAKLDRLAGSTRSATGLHVNVAVGYGGRREIVDAVKELLRDADARGMTAAQVADTLDADQISRYLYTRGQPDPDLLIRTSGEQRLSGFLTWQSAYSEFYFCEALWPDFRKIDFLRALRDFENRQRRFGS